MSTANKKPHLLKVKKEIVSVIDREIRARETFLQACRSVITERELRRELAIWIRQRNRLAAETDIPLIELNHKDGQGNLIY